MRNFLLIFLSLMITGCKAKSVVTGCKDGWVEFTCKYPKTNGKSRQKKMVASRQLEKKNFGIFMCENPQGDKSSPDTETLKLVVDDGCQTPFNQTAYRTAKTTISCDKRNDSRFMFFCKEKGSICENILSTKSSLKSNGSFTLLETSSSFNVSISNVSSEHAGVYWCGVETNEGYRAALRKIQLKVEVPPTTSSHAASSLPGTISVVVCVAVLVLLLILVFVWKRFQRLKDTRNGEQNNEDGAYEEIQERLQKPGSGTALSTIYVTANAPTNPSASQHYSTVNFPNSSGEASGDTYLTVWDSGHSPTHSAVNHPSRLSEDPFYSTVNNPQQH